MNEENTRRIFEDFPFLFKHKENLRASLMGFGFECGDGWFDLIYNLCKDIGKEYRKMDENARETFYVQQVKEKFAGLRFYTSHLGNEKISDLIEEAENKSYKICELCGNETGSVHTSSPSGVGGWYRTLCEKCAKESDYHPAKW